MTLELARDSASGAYKRAERSSGYPERYFTAYIRYEGDATSGTFYEEIDVLARDASDAQIIAECAMQRDYIEGGKVHDVVERERGWIFHDV